jgi:hypothetical protein
VGDDDSTMEEIPWVGRGNSERAIGEVLSMGASDAVCTGLVRVRRREEVQPREGGAILKNAVAS